jgi:hypothetical protein
MRIRLLIVLRGGQDCGFANSSNNHGGSLIASSEWYTLADEEGCGGDRTAGRDQRGVWGGWGVQGGASCQCCHGSIGCLGLTGHVDEQHIAMSGQ